MLRLGYNTSGFGCHTLESALESYDLKSYEVIIGEYRNAVKIAGINGRSQARLRCAPANRNRG